MIIRSAVQDDVVAVAALWAGAAGPTRSGSGTVEAAQLLDRDPRALLVAEVGGDIVGTLIVGWDGWRCHLYRMAVDPGHRRSGIATALFEEAANRAKLLGARRIDAMVADENDSGITYWRSLGFQLDTDDHRWSLML